MANHASAKKRARQSEKKRIRNKSYKSSIRALEKQIREIVKEGKNSQVAEQKLKVFSSQMDKSVKKNVFHPNKANRKKSQLATLIHKS